MSVAPSMADRPFGCPPDNPLEAASRGDGGISAVAVDSHPPSRPRCSCGSKLKTVATVAGERVCGLCYRRIVRGSNKSAKPSKYGAVRTEVDGITFNSKGEARRYGELKLLEQAGYIRKLELQPVFKIEINGRKLGKRGRYYKADFAYFEGTQRIVEDFKGESTDLYKFKKDVVEALYYPLKIREVKAR